jgi:hypothetical protein
MMKPRLVAAAQQLLIALLLGAAAQASPRPAERFAEPLPDHCQTLRVIARSFGPPMASHDPLAMDPDHQQGRQVIVSLSNGLKLEFAEDSQDMLFFANFDVNHRVDVCIIPHRKPITYVISDRITGSFSEARPVRLSPAGGQ